MPTTLSPRDARHLFFFFFFFLSLLFILILCIFVFRKSTTRLIIRSVWIDPNRIVEEMIGHSRESEVLRLALFLLSCTAGVVDGIQLLVDR